MSSYVDYSQPDLESFWRSGVMIWDEIKRYASYIPARTGTVVEIGCGLGRVTRAMASEAGTVDAFDISPEMIDRAAIGAPANVRFHVTSGDNLYPALSNSAELVLAYLVFQHLPNEQAYARCLQEMVRVAKPGGKVVFTTSPRDWNAYALPLLRARAYAAKLLRSDGPKGLYRPEWTGIRPSAARTMGLSPIPLTMTALPNRRWLYCGTK
ncbi:MAG: class I SAM-dependent methyltransferase [Terriglobales bacterium]